MFRAFLCALAVLGLTQAPARDTPPHRIGTTGIITGRVVSADTGEAIRTARVIVKSAAPADPIVAGRSGPIPPRRADQSPAVYSDNEGRFTVPDVPAGRIVISAEKAGYVATMFGARRPGVPPIWIDLKAGGRVDAIEVRMPRSGAISGRIVDEFGDPAEAVTVTAQRLWRIDGFNTTIGLAEAVTDDRGEYRVGGLPAGKFFVTAVRDRSTRTLSRVMSPDGTWSFEVQTPQASATYYPGVSAFSQAQSVDVRAGEERTGMDFVVGARNPSRLTISFVDMKGNATPASGIVVSVGGDGVRPLPRPLLAGGARQTTAIEPGIWAVYARGEAGIGTSRVAVGSGDEGVTVVLARGARVAGRVVSESGALPSHAVIEIGASPVDLAVIAPPGLSVSERAGPDGAFELNDLLVPFVLRARVSGAPGWMTKAIVHRGLDLIDSPIALNNGDTLAGVEVVLTDKLAALRGSVLEAGKPAAADYSVVLFPEDRAFLRNPRRLSRWIRPGPSGDFAVDGLLPGAYLIAALDDVDETGWLNADYLERLRPRATRIELRANETQTVVLDRIHDR